MTSNNFFLCDAQYYGSNLVEGALSPSMLTSLAEAVLNSHQSVRGYAKLCLDKLPKGDRCQLQIDEERLRVTSSRKDEGFESDSESSSSHNCDETVRGSHEVKVINDHVLRLEKLLRQDSGIHRSLSSTSEDGGASSLSSSSGAESEEEISRIQSKTNTGSTESSPHPRHSDLGGITKSQNEYGPCDNFLMCDILFCHVLSHRPKVIIVVVKSVESNIIVAHVFECVTCEAARTLYSNYHVASNKYKLSRYRNSRRRSDQSLTDDKIHVSIRNINNTESNSPGEQRITNETANRNISVLGGPRKTKSYKFGDLPGNSKEESNKVVPSTETSNVNVIAVNDNKRRCAMMQRIDCNGVTHIEIESSPCSLPPTTSISDSRNIIKGTPIETGDVLSALDRLSLHSSNNPDSYLNYVGVSSSCPNSLIITSREIIAAGERERKSRQRHPPLYITEDTHKRLDSLSRKQTRRSQRRNRSKSEERKPDLETNAHFGPDPMRSSVHRMISSPELSHKPKFKEDEYNAHDFERQSRARNASRSRELTYRSRSSHNKRPAPQPPPRRHPNNPSLILVPTKTGQENTKSYYPKESHIMRGSKILRIDHPIYPPWNINADINNNPQRIYYATHGWVGSHEYHSSRNNDFYASEMKKRSRSKSPARRPMAHRYIDAVSTLNISQKLKDFSDCVIQSIKNSPTTSHLQNTLSSAKEDSSRMTNKKTKKTSGFSQLSPMTGKEDLPRPVIKRGKKDESSTDSRRVTFSSYATVQVMD